VVAAAGSPADLPDPWQAIDCGDTPCDRGIRITVSTTQSASLCRFIPNATKEQIAEQQNVMVGMLKRMGVLSPIVWAAYWGESDLMDCECLWVLKGELAKLYDYLNAGIASETGMPELLSTSFVKLPPDSASIVVKPKSSQGSPYRRFRSRSRKSTRLSRKKKKRPAFASGADNRAKPASRFRGEQEHAPGPRRHRTPKRAVEQRRGIVASNLKMRASGLCLLFDNEKIPLTQGLSEAGSWVKAYRSPIYKHAVEQLIYLDRKAAKSKN